MAFASQKKGSSEGEHKKGRGRLKKKFHVRSGRQGDGEGSVVLRGGGGGRGGNHR